MQGVTYVGPQPGDPEVLSVLPEEPRRFLEHRNGLVAYDGGLHIRGACDEPAWHSLARVWTGPLAFHERYPAVLPTDIPFAQDAVGDQWLLRDERVIRLLAETGDVEALDQSFDDFLQAPVLRLQPLLRFQSEGGTLAPGQLLSVYPPFCTKEAADGVSLAAVPAEDRLAFLADFARALR